MMTCEETRRNFSPHLDGEMAREEAAALEAHLDLCPVCRLQLDQARSLLRSLSMVERPVPPADLTASIRNAIQIERAAARARPSLTLSERLTRWVEPHLMPYAVGAFYSLLLFIAVFGALRHQLMILHDLANEARLDAETRVQVTWVGPAVTGGGDAALATSSRSLSPELYAATRLPFASESPSLNPRGALAALAWTPPSTGRPGDDDMIVVADVYGNGNASLAAIVEPPRNPRVLKELQDALRKNPAFVPAAYDRRPQTMRVVFVLQKMNVEERSY